MSAEPKPAAGIAQADHDAAVAAAEKKGYDAGAKAAGDRLNAALGADGVKGDAGRMAAAIELAAKSPAMSGEDIAAFVATNVGAAKPGASTYEQQRLAASGLAQPAPVQTAPAASAGWAKTAEKINKRNG